MIVYKNFRFKDQYISMNDSQIMNELLCVNAPLHQTCIDIVKWYFKNKATFVYFRDEPLILFHGQNDLGFHDDQLQSSTLCLYHLPIFSSNVLVFKCFERYCKFEIKIPLRVHLKDFFGYYNEFETHKCLININSNEWMWIIEPEEASFFNSQSSNTLFKRMDLGSNIYRNRCF